ncbi:hypothetical protein N8919_02025, partial [Planktomarina temperata]|nr:hypothetical protein [Planktomarina temperata]
MSYTQLTDTVIVSEKKLTGYSLETVEKNDGGAALFTTLIYFDDKFNEVGQKTIDHANSIETIEYRVYADESAVAAGNYIEYGSNIKKNSSDEVTQQVTWEFSFVANEFDGGTQLDGVDGGAQVTATFDKNWLVTGTSASLGSGIGNAINATDNSSDWLGLPSSFTSGATEITYVEDTTTGIVDYYDTSSSNTDIYVGSKYKFSWDANGNTANGFSYENAAGEFLGDGGNDGVNEWLNLRETVAATGTSSDKHGGKEYVVETGSFKVFEADGKTVA